MTNTKLFYQKLKGFNTFIKRWNTKFQTLIFIIIECVLYIASNIVPFQFIQVL